MPTGQLIPRTSERTEVGPLAPPAAAAPSALRGLLSAHPAWVLGGLVLVSALARWGAAAGHHTPTFFQDEYVYSALAEALATMQGLNVRGEDVAFPALLLPLLSAPAWLAGDPALALRLTQGLNAVAMSLAAVPVYLLARHLRLSAPLALATAAFVLVHPGLLLSSFWLAEPIALPLALGAFYAGVRGLERPTAAAQLTFLLLAGLAAFARIQFVFLPVVFLISALVLARGDLRRFVRRFSTTLAALAVPLLLLAILTPQRVLGAYWHFDGWHEPAVLAEWSAKALLLLAYSAGWVLVPGAVAALVAVLVRPSGSADRPFAVLLLASSAALLFQVAAIAAIGDARVEERYFLMLPPLLAVAFGMWWTRGHEHRRLAVAVGLGMLLVSARVPLAEYTVAGGAAGSPTLRALVALETTAGAANASLLFALAAAALSLVAVAGAVRTRWRGVGLGCALAAALALSLGAHAQDWQGADRTRANLLAGDARWVDRLELGGVSLLQTPGAQPARALSQLFWNRSLDELLLLDETPPVDSLPSTRASVADDGTVLAGGDEVVRPLLVSGEATQIELAGATLLAREAEYGLWLPEGAARVSSLVVGAYSDGWLAGEGLVTVWPDGSGRVRGTLTLALELPAGEPPNALLLSGQGVSRRVELAPGGSETVAIPVDADRRWELHFQAERRALDERLRSLGVRGAATFTRTEP